MDCFVRFAPRNDSYAKTARRANHFVFSEMACPAPFAKIFLFRPEANQFTESCRLVPLEGRIAIVTDAGRDAVDAGSALDEMCCRGRRSRVVLTPQCRRQVCDKKRRRRCQTSLVTGESAK